MDDQGLEAVWMSEAMLLLKARWTSTVCATIGGRSNVCASDCCWRPCGCKWPTLLSDAMLMFVVHADAESHVRIIGPTAFGVCGDVSGPWCH